MDVQGSDEATFTAFLGDLRIAAGPRGLIAARARAAAGDAPNQVVRIFDDATGDWYTLDSAFLNRGLKEKLAADEVDDDRPGRGPGRPKLGVVPREVTLLPRHWEWLNTQPGGASAALRRLVEGARRDHAGADVVRRARQTAYRFLSVMAGDQPGFEEAIRALFAGDARRFNQLVSAWPKDVAAHAAMLAAAGFPGEQHESA